MQVISLALWPYRYFQNQWCLPNVKDYVQGPGVSVQGSGTSIQGPRYLAVPCTPMSCKPLNSNHIDFIPYKVPLHFEDLARFSIDLERFCLDLAHFEHDFARICLNLSFISQNGRIFEKNVTERMRKEANSHISSKNVTECSGRALEYEKALPRKGKVFQMKCLPQSNGLQKAAKWAHFWEKCDQTGGEKAKRAHSGRKCVRNGAWSVKLTHFEKKRAQMRTEKWWWPQNWQKCGRMCYGKEDKVIANPHNTRGLRSGRRKIYLIIN